MFGLFEPKLPVTDEQKAWIDGSLVRLASLLCGTARLRDAIVLPTPEHFPDPYDNSEEALHRIFRRVAARMQVDPDQIEVVLFDSADRMTSGLVPFYSGSHSAAAGLYHHNSTGKTQISIEGELLKDPMALVGVLAHELGHVILLRPGLLDPKEKDMEPLTDLLTVFFGLGIFTANSAFRFKQYSNNSTQGWSAKKLGYLSEEHYGYALGRYAFERGETKPPWIKHLCTNVAGYTKRSLRWLSANAQARLFSGR